MVSRGKGIRKFLYHLRDTVRVLASFPSLPPQPPQRPSHLEAREPLVRRELPLPALLVGGLELVQVPQLHRAPLTLIRRGLRAERERQAEEEDACWRGKASRFLFPR